MALQNVISLENAWQRGHQHWKAILDQWGNRGTDADAQSNGYVINRPVYGAQIASESDVGEVEVSFFDGQTIATVGDRVVREDQLYIRRGRPYMWRTPAPLTISSTKQTKYRDTYHPINAANPTVTAAFGGALATTIFPNPRLVVIFFLQPNPTPVVEPTRPGETFLLQTLSINDVAAHTCYFQNVQHYDSARVTLENESATDPLEVRLTGLTGFIDNSGFVITENTREYDLFSNPLVVPPLTRIVQPVAKLEATWLGVYAEKQVNSGASDFNWVIRADD